MYSPSRKFQRPKHFTERFKITKADLGINVDVPFLQHIPIPESVNPKATSIHSNVSIASYNWLDTGKPTIAVPGCPNFWSPPSAFPIQVKPDTEPIYIDQASYRLPKTPMQPIFESVNLMKPDLDFAGLDIFTDRNNIRKLFNLVRGAEHEKVFRIDVEMVGKTLVLRRFETQSRAMPFNNSFGHRFEEQMTQAPMPALSQATAYHRVSLLEWAGLKFLLRFEVDAAEKTSIPSKTSLFETEFVEKDEPSLSGLNIRQKSREAENDALDTQKGLLTIKKVGMIVDPASVLELGTRSTLSKVAYEWQDKWLQVYIAATPVLYFGKHTKGLFTKPVKYTVQEMEEEAGPSARDNLSKVHSLLLYIRDLAEKQSDCKLILIGEKDTLKAYKGARGAGFDESMRAHFNS